MHPAVSCADHARLLSQDSLREREGGAVRAALRWDGYPRMDERMRPRCVGGVALRSERGSLALFDVDARVAALVMRAVPATAYLLKKLTEGGWRQQGPSDTGTAAASPAARGCS